MTSLSEHFAKHLGTTVMTSAASYLMNSACAGHQGEDVSEVDVRQVAIDPFSLIIQLGFLDGKEKGTKFCVKDHKLFIQSPNFFQSLSRRLSGVNRDITLRYKTVIEKAVQWYPPSENKEMVKIFEKAVLGLQALHDTYSGDELIQAEIKVFIRVIESSLKEESEGGENLSAYHKRVKELWPDNLILSISKLFDQAVIQKEQKAQFNLSDLQSASEASEKDEAPPAPNQLMTSLKNTLPIQQMIEKQSQVFGDVLYQELVGFLSFTKPETVNTKEKEYELKKIAVDPLTVMIQLGFLFGMPKGTKIAIDDYRLVFHEPAATQGLLRALAGAKRGGLLQLESLFVKAAEWYQPHKDKRVAYIFLRAAAGLSALKETYASSEATKKKINEYIVDLKKACFEETKFVAPASDYEEKVKKLWGEEQLNSMIALLSVAAGEQVSVSEEGSCSKSESSSRFKKKDCDELKEDEIQYKVVIPNKLEPLKNDMSAIKQFIAGQAAAFRKIVIEETIKFVTFAAK